MPREVWLIQPHSTTLAARNFGKSSFKQQGQRRRGREYYRVTLVKRPVEMPLVPAVYTLDHYYFINVARSPQSFAFGHAVANFMHW
eukprot:scaffold182827_cov85-Attheya_sp.AAC.1